VQSTILTACTAADTALIVRLARLAVLFNLTVAIVIHGITANLDWMSWDADRDRKDPFMSNIALLPEFLGIATLLAFNHLLGRSTNSLFARAGMSYEAKTTVTAIAPCSVTAFFIRVTELTVDIDSAVTVVIHAITTGIEIAGGDAFGRLDAETIEEKLLGVAPIFAFGDDHAHGSANTVQTSPNGTRLIDITALATNTSSIITVLFRLARDAVFFCLSVTIVIHGIAADLHDVIRDAFGFRLDACAVSASFRTEGDHARRQTPPAVTPAADIAMLVAFFRAPALAAAGFTLIVLLTGNALVLLIVIDNTIAVIVPVVAVFPNTRIHLDVIVVTIITIDHRPDKSFWNRLITLRGPVENVGIAVAIAICVAQELLRRALDLFLIHRPAEANAIGIAAAQIIRHKAAINRRLRTSTPHGDHIAVRIMAGIVPKGSACHGSVNSTFIVTAITSAETETLIGLPIAIIVAVVAELGAKLTIVRRGKQAALPNPTTMLAHFSALERLTQTGFQTCAGVTSAIPVAVCVTHAMSGITVCIFLTTAAREPFDDIAAIVPLAIIFEDGRQAAFVIVATIRTLFQTREVPANARPTSVGSVAGEIVHSTLKLHAPDLLLDERSVAVVIRLARRTPFIDLPVAVVVNGLTRLSVIERVSAELHIWREFVRRRALANTLLGLNERMTTLARIRVHEIARTRVFVIAVELCAHTIQTVVHAFTTTLHVVGNRILDADPSNAALVPSTDVVITTVHASQTLRPVSVITSPGIRRTPILGVRIAIITASVSRRMADTLTVWILRVDQPVGIVVNAVKTGLAKLLTDFRLFTLALTFSLCRTLCRILAVWRRLASIFDLSKRPTNLIQATTHGHQTHQQTKNTHDAPLLSVIGMTRFIVFSLNERSVIYHNLFKTLHHNYPRLRLKTRACHLKQK